MTKCDISFPLPLPDDPRKWQGWSNYRSPNLYERLCLDPHANPSNELIEEHCRELMRWWQKKLPLKKQPSNPLAQLLRSGLKASSRYLTEAHAKTSSVNPQEEFLNLLRLSNLDSFSISDDHRDTFIDMAENLGLDPGEAEDLVDLYLEEADEKAFADQPGATPRVDGKSV